MGIENSYGVNTSYKHLYGLGNSYSMMLRQTNRNNNSHENILHRTACAKILAMHSLNYWQGTKHILITLSCNFIWPKHTDNVLS